MDNIDPLAEVARQLKAYARAKTEAAERIAKAKASRDAAIRAASVAGARQVDLVRATGLTRESIRRIVADSDSPK